MSNVKLDKATWELSEIIKETVKKNITNATATKQLKLEVDMLPSLFSLIDSSTSEAYSKSHKSFSKKFEKISQEIITENQSLKKRK